MARQVLADLADAYLRRSGIESTESVGRGCGSAVQAGEAFDGGARRRCDRQACRPGHVVADSRSDLVRPARRLRYAKAAHGRTSDRKVLCARRAVRAHARPFHRSERHGTDEAVRAMGHCRLRSRSPRAGVPGVPVGKLVADGQVEPRLPAGE
ncbi:MAG: hypothetical protein M5R42_01625 [Rhodocyclaceae bacterium]|nr:hypothetical protein [Rhodocyclaceae bacterium]